MVLEAVAAEGLAVTGVAQVNLVEVLEVAVRVLVEVLRVKKRRPILALEEEVGQALAEVRGVTPLIIVNGQPPHLE